MKNITNRQRLLPPVILSIIIVNISCVSPPHHPTGDIRGASLQKLEDLVIPLEAMGGVEARKNEALLIQAREAVIQTEKEADTDDEYRGQIAAWSGRLAILEGRYSEARLLYRQSMTMCPGYVPMSVLGIRLAGDPALRLELVERELLLADSQRQSPGYGEMHIEKARSLLDMNRYGEAVSAFTTAFESRLAPIYRQSYQKDMDRAIELQGSGVFGY
jgi:tetratricopeptide (TPR) repeat protein